jgi:hypothetical protein
LKKENPDKSKDKVEKKSNKEIKQVERSYKKKSLQKVRNHSSHSFVQNNSNQNLMTNTFQKVSLSTKTQNGPSTNPRPNLNSNIFKSIK